MTGCEAEWGCCPDHGATLIDTAGKSWCRVCGRTWDYHRGGTPCDEPAAYQARDDANGPIMWLCKGHTLALPRQFSDRVQPLPWHWQEEVREMNKDTRRALWARTADIARQIRELELEATQWAELERQAAATERASTQPGDFDLAGALERQSADIKARITSARRAVEEAAAVLDLGEDR